MTAVMEITVACELCGNELAEPDRTWIGTAVDGTRIYVCAHRCSRSVRRTRRTWRAPARFFRDMCKAMAASRWALPMAGLLLALAAYAVLSDHAAWLPFPVHSWLNVK